MPRNAPWNSILVMPDDLIAFAWSAPMRDLAAQLGMSDVGLKKLLASYGIAPPPQGYWNKVRAGKPVPPRPRHPPRRPGESGRFSVDRRFANVIPSAEPMPSTGPFTTAAVPEDLEELRAQELKAIGRVRVPRSLDRPHSGLIALLRKEKQRRDKNAGRDWQLDPPKFDGPLDQRKLRLTNAILLALAGRGHTGNVSEASSQIHGRAIVGGTYLGLRFEVVGRHRTIVQDHYKRPAPDLPASTPLALWIDPGFDARRSKSWEDDEDGKLETKVGAIAAGIIVAGEAQFRRSLRDREARLEQERLEQERRRQARLDEMNRQRVADLLASGDLLRRSQEIRAVVQRVRAALLDSGQVDAATFRVWEQWALAEADKLDPILSGQVQTHLHAPTLDEGSS